MPNFYYHLFKVWQKSILSQRYECPNTSCCESGFFLSSLFQTAVTTPNFDETKKFQNPEDSQWPEVDAEFWNFSKIFFLAWVMGDTVWFQIMALFDGFLHQMSLFVVFSVFTSICHFFLSISFQTPLKNPSRRAGGTKASGFVPPSLRDGFLRGVINLMPEVN